MSSNEEFGVSSDFAEVLRNLGKSEEFGVSSDFAEVLRNLSKSIVDSAKKELYDAIKKEHEKDKINYYVNLNIEVPDDTTRKFMEILLIQRQFFSNYNYFERYKKINVKVNKDIGKEKIINIYLYVTPANPSMFNINDERVILKILKKEEDFFKNSFSFNDFDEKLFMGAFKIKMEESGGKKESFFRLIQSKLVQGIRKYEKEYKLNVQAVWNKVRKK